MKQTRLMKMLAIGAVSTLALSTALAQTSSTTTSVGAGPVGVGVTTSTNASMLDGTGTLQSYTPGADYLMFRSEASAAPAKYYYNAKDTVVVDSEGATVDWKLLRPDMPVRYSYVKDGDRMVIRKITLTKPVSYYEKTTTTTTTTKP
ncbi:MAG: hypothetical protein ACR2MF_00490 [Chthoniobacterales bacterium]